MKKTKKEWVRLFNKWVDLAMTLEEGGCKTRYSFSIYSGDGDYVSLSFNYGGVEVQQNYNGEATQEDIDALENAFNVAVEDTKTIIHEKLEELVKGMDSLDQDIQKYSKMLDSLEDNEE